MAWMIPLLTSFGPAGLSALFGGDPQKQLRDQIMRLLSPDAQGQSTNRFYQQFLASPAFQQAQGNIAGGANAVQGQLAQRVGAGGYGSSGTGALMNSITPSIVGGQQSALHAAGYGFAQNQAMETLKQQIAALTGTAGPSQTRQFLGGGLDAFAPYLQAYLKNKYPKTFGTEQPQQAAQGPNPFGGMVPTYGQL
jgi:hypothetical protein